MSFESLGLSAELLRAIADQGYSTPTPIQAEAIPAVLTGRDLLAAAQTGTGKTAGFTLPLLQRLHGSSREGGKRHVRALILVPTRELAAQVHDDIENYGRHLPLKAGLVFGGVGFNGQASMLRRGVDLLVATPGRLLDHVNQKTVDLSKVEALVLDEADRMLDMGFIRDIRRVLEQLPSKRQNLMFSATFSGDIRKLANTLLTDPVSIEIERKDIAAGTVNQSVHLIEQTRKRELLSYLIGSNQWKQVLVFTRTKHGANRLAKQLDKDGINSTAIHGNKSQGARTRALAEFKSGKVEVLVATDIAARGLDIDELPHVINFELPNIPEDYVHRIGRTGRAGHGGDAISLVSSDELEYLGGIQRLLGREIPRSIVEGYEPEDPRLQGKIDFRAKGKSSGRGNGGQSGNRGQARSRSQQGGQQGSQRGNQRRHQGGQRRRAQSSS